jgi:hypothetical protein
VLPRRADPCHERSTKDIEDGLLDRRMDSLPSAFAAFVLAPLDLLSRWVPI